MKAVSWHLITTNEYSQVCVETLTDDDGDRQTEEKRQTDTKGRSEAEVCEALCQNLLFNQDIYVP